MDYIETTQHIYYQGQGAGNHGLTFKPPWDDFAASSFCDWAMVVNSQQAWKCFFCNDGQKSYRFDGRTVVQILLLHCPDEPQATAFQDITADAIEVSTFTQSQTFCVGSTSALPFTALFPTPVPVCNPLP